jgi:hypothetical protein
MLAMRMAAGVLQPGARRCSARLMTWRPLRRRPRRPAILVWGTNVQPIFAKPYLDSAGCGLGMPLTGNVSRDDGGLQVWRFDQCFPEDRIV